MLALSSKSKITKLRLYDHKSSNVKNKSSSSATAQGIHNISVMIFIVGN